MITALKGFARHIKKPQNGYTIVEVMLVLAVSTLMLLAATRVFKGRQADQQYTQAIQDLSSKIVNFGTEVSAGIFPASEGFSCQLDSQGTPVLSTASSTAGDVGFRAPCLFLGRAIQVVPGSGDLHLYTVMGSKSTIIGNLYRSNPKTVIDESHPVIAHTGLDNLVLYEKYKIPSGAKIMSSKFISAGTTYGTGIKYDLAGIYNGVSGISPTSGPSQIMLWGYPIDSTVASNVPNNNRLPLGDSSVDGCVRNSCVTTVDAEKWELCVQNPENSRSILMTVESAASGLITSMKDIAC